MRLLIAHGSGIDDLISFLVIVGVAAFFIRRADTRARANRDETGPLSSDSDE